jgi:ribose-phosphate pyrophosphokinase
MGKTVLLVDDICDAGGTFLGLQTILEGHGATSDLFVTHGLFSAGTKALRRSFRTLYATDSLHYPADGVKYLPIVNGMIDQCN